MLVRPPLAILLDDQGGEQTRYPQIEDTHPRGLAAVGGEPVQRTPVAAYAPDRDLYDGLLFSPPGLPGHMEAESTKLKLALQKATERGFGIWLMDDKGYFLFGGFGDGTQRKAMVCVNDPDLAGRIVATLSSQGEEAIVVEALIVYAYDAERLDANPDLSLSLEKDKQFLQYLMDTQGGGWVQQHMEEAIRKYDRLIRDGEMDEEFLRAYAATLEQIVSLERDSARRMALEEAFDGAFQGATGRSLSAY